jgi:hypothetical protein
VAESVSPIFATAFVAPTNSASRLVQEEKEDLLLAVEKAAAGAADVLRAARLKCLSANQRRET